MAYSCIAAVLVLAAIIYTKAHSGGGTPCTSDTDCAMGCCYNDTLHGQHCHEYQNLTQACHLPNHTVKVMLYPCGCMQGLTCDEIHFDPSLPDPVHQAELLLLGHGYGLCTDTPGKVFVGK